MSKSRSQKRLEGILNVWRPQVPHPTLRVAELFYRNFDTPLGYNALKLLQKGDIDALISLEVDPSTYSDWRRYSDDKAVVSFLKKYPFPGRSKVTRSAALRVFEKGEADCAATNEAFKAWDSGRLRFRPDVEAVMMAARYKISQVLGDFDVEEWLTCCRFGPGVNVGVPGESAYVKLSSTPSMTQELAAFVPSLLTEFPGWKDALTYGGSFESRIKIFPGGKHSLVPKDARVDRNIETQPLLNGFLQLGLGHLIRRLLKKVGIDLDNQEVNQRLAEEGSITGLIATMDLSNASDSIAYQVVKFLLSGSDPAWFYAMDLTRTRRITMRNEVGGHEVRELHRFSSMGNGFTFELESLIFWALAKCASETIVHRSRVSVYGDDIIVPSTAFDLVESVLNTCGFTVNKKKSFSSGPFRESCGADYFNGINVRPYFSKKEVVNVADLVSLANGIRRASHRRNRYFGYDVRFASAWYRCLRWIPVEVRRTIAFGNTEHDDFILSPDPRTGRRIVFQLKKKADLQYFPAKAVALYNVHRRVQDDVDDKLHDLQTCNRLLTYCLALDKMAMPALDTSLTLAAKCRSNGNGHVFSYRRGVGRFVASGLYRPDGIQGYHQWW